MSIDFCAIDFETANPKRGSVCSMALRRVRDGSIVERTGGFITPPPGIDHFDPMCTHVHGIRERDVKGAPTWDQVAPWLAQFVGDDLLVAHNAPFERSVIVQASDAHGIVAPPLTLVCSVEMAKYSFPKLPKHKLPAVVKACGLTMGKHHEAGADTDACAEITVAMIRRAGFDDLDDFVAAAGVKRRAIAPSLVGATAAKR